LLSEFGGIAYPLPGSRIRARIMGICYTRLTGVEQEINGLLTYDRKPKFDSRIPREINGLVN
jgi:hypothetical protein